jgi:hypothetical protein
MLIRHDTIYLDAHGSTTHALLIRDGRVVATGDDAIDGRDRGERVHEPDAACVFPALADAHCHLWGVGLREGAIDLEGTSSPSDVCERLKAFDVDASPSGWVLGHGWDEHGWPKGASWRRSDVDEALPDTPLCLHRIDRHAIVVNAEALRRAGLDEHYTASNPSGRVIRDEAGKIVVLVDTAMRPLLESIPEPTEAEDEAIFRRTAERYRSLGITSAHMALLEPNRISMLERLRREDDLPLRVYGIVDAFHQDIPGVLERGPVHDEDAWLSIRAAKLFADGALGSQGALLHEAYPDGSHGIEMMDVETLRERTLRYTEAGFQVATHAIGDAGATAVLDAYEAVDPETRRRLRLRLEHAQMMTDRDLERLVDMGIVASIQAIHLRSDAAWAPDELSEAQLSTLYPWHGLTAGPIASGSDFPIEDPNPWHGVATAMTRRAKDGSVFQPERALSVEQALASYTTGAAFAGFWESRLGKLEAGFIADFVELDRDPLRESPESIWDTQVTRTWTAERV